MRELPTLPEVIAALPNLEELDGAEAQIKRDGRLTSDVMSAILIRRAQLQRRTR